MSLADRTHVLDALIIGGGIAGLWTLDELVRRGASCLLVERDALGAGQTIWSQGIIHGGLKYTLAGLMNPSAEAIREMPGVWRECLAGRREPDLSHAQLRSSACYLWQTSSLLSRAGMIGARVGLRVAPAVLDARERPPLLRASPGVVARLDEQVIDPAAVLEQFRARHAVRLCRAEAASCVREDGLLHVELRQGVVAARVACRTLVLTAGNGMGALRAMLGLAPGTMQVRPLRMVMLRGAALPALFGHCVDGSKTRVTITAAQTASGETVWQIGGELAEQGVGVEPAALCAHARRELRAVLPGVDVSSCRWATYDAPRAEPATPGNRRPDDAAILVEGAIITAWPTKLALAPRLAELIAREIEPSRAPGLSDRTAPPGFDVPIVAAPPWDAPADWINDAELAP